MRCANYLVWLIITALAGCAHEGQVPKARGEEPLGTLVASGLDRQASFRVDEDRIWWRDNEGRWNVWKDGHSSALAPGPPLERATPDGDRAVFWSPIHPNLVLWHLDSDRAHITHVLGDQIPAELSWPHLLTFKMENESSSELPPYWLHDLNARKSQRVDAAFIGTGPRTIIQNCRLNGEVLDCLVQETDSWQLQRITPTGSITTLVSDGGTADNFLLTDEWLYLESDGNQYLWTDGRKLALTPCAGESAGSATHGGALVTLCHGESRWEFKIRTASGWKTFVEGRNPPPLAFDLGTMGLVFTQPTEPGRWDLRAVDLPAS